MKKENEMDVAETAVYVNRSTETIYRWIREHKVSARLVLGKWLIDRESVDALLNGIPN